VDSAIAKVEQAIEAIAKGEMVILVDDEDRENEGDLCMAAEKVRAEDINFMAKYGRGLICLSMTGDRCERLQLPMMTGRNTSRFGTAFTVSIEGRRGVSTGISAADRATTIRTAVAPDATSDDLVTPGHVFPLKAERGGVLVRTGQTEGSVDLARLAGLEPAGVICEVMRDDGTMARMPDLEVFSREHGVLIVSIADLIEYRLQRESLVERAADGPYMPGFEGLTEEFHAYVYRSVVGNSEFMALVLGNWDPEESVLVRVHSACIGDVFNSQRCDCGTLLRRSLKMINDEGKGVLLYILPHRIRLAQQFNGHVLHRDDGRHTEQDWMNPLRGFGLGAQILMDLGVKRIRLMTNNPKRLVGLAGYGLELVERVAVPVPETRHNLAYLNRKRQRGEHQVGSDGPGAVQGEESKKASDTRRKEDNGAVY